MDTFIGSSSSVAETPFVNVREYKQNVENLENEIFTLKVLLWQLDHKTRDFLRSNNVNEDLINTLIEQEKMISKLNNELAQKNETDDDINDDGNNGSFLKKQLQDALDDILKYQKELNKKPNLSSNSGSSILDDDASNVVELQTQIESLQSQNAVLKEQIEHARTENEELKNNTNNNNNKLKKENIELNEQNQNLNEELVNLKNEFKSYKKEENIKKIIDQYVEKQENTAIFKSLNTNSINDVLEQYKNLYLEKEQIQNKNIELVENTETEINKYKKLYEENNKQNEEEKIQLNEKYNEAIQENEKLKLRIEEIQQNEIGDDFIIEESDILGKSLINQFNKLNKGQLKKKCIETIKDNKILKNQLEECQEKLNINNNLENEYNEMENQNVELKNEIENLKQKIEDLQRDNNNISESFTIKEPELNSDSSYQDDDIDISQLKRKCIELRRDNKNMKKQLEECQEKLSASNDEIEKQNKIIKEENNELKKKIAELQEEKYSNHSESTQITRLVSDSKQYEESSIDLLRSSDDNSKLSLSSYSDDIYKQNFEKHFNKIQNAFKENSNPSSKPSGGVIESSQTIKQLNKQIQQIKDKKSKEIENLKNQIKLLEKDPSNYIEKYNKLFEDSCKLSLKEKELNQHLDNISNGIYNYNIQIRAEKISSPININSPSYVMKEHINSLKKRNQITYCKVDKLQNKFISKSYEVIMKQDFRIKKLTNENKNILEKFNEIQKNILILQKENINLQNEIENQKPSSNKIEELQEKINILQDKNNGLIEKNEKCDAIINKFNEFKEHHNNTKRQIEILKKENSDLVKKNNILSQNKIASQEENELLKSKNICLANDNEKLRSSSKESDKNYQIKQSELQNKINDLQIKIEKLIQENSLLTKEVKDLKIIKMKYLSSLKIKSNDEITNVKSDQINIPSNISPINKNVNLHTNQVNKLWQKLDFPEKENSGLKENNQRFYLFKLNELRKQNEITNQTFHDFIVICIQMLQDMKKVASICISSSEAFTKKYSKTLLTNLDRKRIIAIQQKWKYQITNNFSQFIHNEMNIHNYNFTSNKNYETLFYSQFQRLIHCIWSIFRKGQSEPKIINVKDKELEGFITKIIKIQQNGILNLKKQVEESQSYNIIKESKGLDTQVVDLVTKFRKEVKTYRTVLHTDHQKLINAISNDNDSDSLFLD